MTLLPILHRDMEGEDFLFSFPSRTFLDIIFSYFDESDFSFPVDTIMIFREHKLCISNSFTSAFPNMCIHWGALWGVPFVIIVVQIFLRLGLLEKGDDNGSNIIHGLLFKH